MSESTSLPRTVISTHTDTANIIRLVDLNDPEINTDYMTVKSPKQFTQWGRVTFLPSESPPGMPSCLTDLPRTILLEEHAIPYTLRPNDYSIGAIGISQDRQFYLDLLRVRETEESTQVSSQRVEGVRPLVHLFERERVGGMPSPYHDRTIRNYTFAPVPKDCKNALGQMQEHPHAIPLKSDDGTDLGRLYFYSPSNDCTSLTNGQIVLHGAKLNQEDKNSPRYSIVMQV